MNSAPSISKTDRGLGGLWGSLVGNALGVPVEFRSREEVKKEWINQLARKDDVRCLFTKFTDLCSKQPMKAPIE
jgi:ADP-ribosylglycohydrolase